MSFVVAVVAAVAAISPGVATASPAAQRFARSVRLPQSGLSLSRAPAGLRAAVLRTLGSRAASGRWSPQTKLAAAPFDLFGFAVAVSGHTAVVGTPGKNSSTGAAYVFERSGRVWSQQAELTASDAARGDAFGRAVAISGHTALVGAPGNNSAMGAAYVFERSGRAWSQHAKLVPSNAEAGDNTGWAVAISGHTALVGVRFHHSGEGEAGVFERSGRTWSEQTELTASDAAIGDAFGSAVAISGNTAVVGAPGKNLGTGSAYVFERSGRTWSQQVKLTASDAAARDEFGFAVAIDGNTALVGAPGKSSGTGAAYVFRRSGRAWSQQAKLTASGAGAGDHFGFAVANDGNTALVGAPGKSSSRGAAYVFERSGMAWSQHAELTASDAAAGDVFGFAVAISGHTALVGAPFKNSDTGAAYAFERSGRAWSQQAKLTE